MTVLPEPFREWEVAYKEVKNGPRAGPAAESLPVLTPADWDRAYRNVAGYVVGKESTATGEGARG